MPSADILKELTEGSILEGPLWTEPVKVLTAKARGGRTEVQAVGTHTQKLWKKLLKPKEFDGTIKVTQAGELAAFDGDPTHFRLAAEAHRIRLAFQYDPHFAVSVSQVDPLPHQMDAVYSHLLTQPRIRFLSADDPSAGKTIMAGLSIKELVVGYPDLGFIGPGHPLFEGVVVILPAPQEIVHGVEGMETDPDVERIAVEVSMKYEPAGGRHPVSVEKENCGWDVTSLLGGEPSRYIEVKGRTGIGGVALTPNEWIRAQRFGKKYWRYVVVNCKTNPELHIIQDPASKLNPKEEVSVVRYMVGLNDWQQAATSTYSNT